MRALACALVALVLAGCADAPESAPVDAAAGAAAEDASGERAAAPAGTADGADAPRWEEVFTFNGTYAAGAAGDLAETSASRNAFDVRKGAQALRVELWWNGTGDMDAVLDTPFACYAPEQECATDEAATRGTGDGRFQNAGGTPASPDSPSVLALDAAQIEAFSECRRASRCGWSVQAYPTAGVELAWTLRVVVTY